MRSIEKLEVYARLQASKTLELIVADIKELKGLLQRRGDALKLVLCKVD
jgi:hypothetical protein